MKSLVFLLLLLPCAAWAQTNYQLPPQEILELADVAAPPARVISPSNTWLALAERPLYKSLEELAEDEVRLAGLRINPANFGPARQNYYTGLKLFRIDGMKELSISGIPAGIRMQNLSFSPKEKYCSFVENQAGKLNVWIIDLQSGNASMLFEGLNAVLGSSYFWASDESAIYVRSNGQKGNLPSKKDLPKGPAVQEATGSKAPARTFQDLLRNKQDEARFDYYASSELLKVPVNGGVPTKILPMGIYKRIAFSPDAQYLLTEEIQQPYSYSLTYSSFPSKFNLRNADGSLIKVFYDRPLQDKIPSNFDAVEAGKRSITWRDDAPSTLIWAEAPDGGDPAKESEYRDEVYQSAAPFDKSTLMCKLKYRYMGMQFGTPTMAVVYDGWWKNRQQRVSFINPSDGQKAPELIFEYSSEDLYAQPGDFHTTKNAWNRDVLYISKNGKHLYLVGEGYAPEGNRPFVDQFELQSKKRSRIWRADGKSTYEQVLRLVDPEKQLAITSIESPNQFPNIYWRNLKSKSAPKQLTNIANPYQKLSGVTKQKISYKRADGVQLSATLYLPEGYSKEKDGRLPMLMEAYPTEYKDDKAAGQVKESPHAFISLYWGSPVYWARRGYAILEDAQFPIVGKGDAEPNDTYIEQLVADAQAAIKAVDSMGVVDPKRCAVMGHSYGGFMTANLLAHSNLFAAGIARSGAYNRTLTPFGFQSEERSYWEATEVYNKMSPFNYAHQIKSPLLLIHGDADNNPGTFTLQSERLFQAIKGNGGVSRLVLLPYESHGYVAKENILHMLWEMDTWLENRVKQKK